MIPDTCRYVRDPELSELFTVSDRTFTLDFVGSGLNSILSNFRVILFSPSSMGLHLVAVAMAKLHLLSPSHSFSTTPLVAALIGPFVLKVSFRLSVLRRVYMDVFDASRFFVFQLSQIASGDDQPATDNGGHRWQRALRLVCQRITHVRRSTVAESEEDSFHTFSMLSL